VRPWIRSPPSVLEGTEGDMVASCSMGPMWPARKRFGNVVLAEGRIFSEIPKKEQDLKER
jgi:hypothetical protein